MTDRYGPVDPSDTVDTDAQDWAEDRTRLLTDGRRLAPSTVADLRAAKAAAGAAEAARFARVFDAPTDRTLWLRGTWREAVG